MAVAIDRTKRNVLTSYVISGGKRTAIAMQCGCKFSKIAGNREKVLIFLFNIMFMDIFQKISTIWHSFKDL